MAATYSEKIIKAHSSLKCVYLKMGVGMGMYFSQNCIYWHIRKSKW